MWMKSNYFILSCSFLTRLRTYVTGTIRSDERVILFPTLGRQVNNNIWEVPIHGWIFEPEKRDKRRRAFLAVLRKALNQTEAKEILDRRASPFLVDNERWKTPRIRILNSDEPEIYRMPRSKKNGHFKCVVTLVANANDTGKLLHSEAVLPDKDTRRFGGVAHLLTDSRLSVISDIDDTIKITNVTDRKSMLRNTFLREFQPVPGMAQVYSKWKRDRGASFHFVSSSPWQLYEELEQFTRREGFPEATFHLKTIRPKDKSILNLFADPFKTKTAEITSIVTRFPKRKFVLVGDSGEKDPEVYGELARTFPTQICQVFIRNVSSDSDIEERMEMAFSQVSRDKWQTFTDPTTIQLPDSLD